MSLCAFVKIGHATALVTRNPATARMKTGKCDKVIHFPAHPGVNLIVRFIADSRLSNGQFSYHAGTSQMGKNQGGVLVLIALSQFCYKYF